ncbi:MAG: hypothetical protein AMXMBFR64_11160 [Myxococcales bacterium]
MDRALLLALPLPGSAPGDTSLLETPVGGVPLLKRQTRLAQAVGAREVTIVCAAAAQGALAASLAGRLAPAPVRWLTVSDPSEAPGAIQRWCAAQDAPFLATSVWDVFERGATARTLSLTPRPGELVVTTVEGRPATLIAAGPGAPLGALLATWPDAAEAPTARELPAKELAGRIRDRASLEAAAHRLWEGCRKPLDGFVSRNLNRHVSLFISRRIAHTGIDPNHISFLNLALGLAGGVIAAMGGYWPFLIAAALLKANSILDGVDGELARMRIQASVLGEWLDTISDDLSNQAFFIGVAIGAWRMTGDASWLALGAATAVPMGLVTAYYYRWCIQNGRGDILAFQWTFQTETLTQEEREAATWLHRTLGFFKTLFRKDAFVMMFLLAAIAGVLPWSLWVVAPAAFATLFMLIGQHFKQRAHDRRLAA